MLGAVVLRARRAGHIQEVTGRSMRSEREAADLDSQHGGLLSSAVGAGGPHSGSALVQLHTHQPKLSRVFST